MNNMNYRKDNKHVLIWAYIAFFSLVLMNMIVNIFNTKKLLNMYILLFTSLGFILSYIVFYLIHTKVNKKPLKLEDNYLAFYVSFYKNNKRLKLISLLIDLLEYSLIILASVFYIYKMKFNDVYNIYPIFVSAILLILNSYVILMDIIKLMSMDRIDAHTSSYKFSIMDKKLLFSLILISLSLSNIGMLSYKTPHFIVRYNDLFTYEIISAITLTISLLSIFISKIYYYHFDMKQIEQKEFKTNILEMIGQGKYAKVYKAYISSLDTIYAVKKLESKDVSDIERFKAEFNIMKALEHQNLLRVYSFDELHYEYVMDYCEYNLEDYITKVDLTNENKRNLTLQLLNSFDYLHAHHIMHRDVSATNIMLKENEETKELTLKVMDFGIAKNNNELKKTRTYTRIRGTLIDPTLEDFSRYNEQNDIYGLGVMINYINYKTDSVIQDDSKISKIVNKCMDLNLTNRYHHVKEIIADYMEASL